MATGVPISGEAGFGYVLDDGYDIPPLMFSRDEITALVAGARLLRAWGGASMARAAEEALIKIEEVRPPDARAQARSVEVHSFAPQMTDAVRGKLDDLSNAIEARTRYRLSYSDVEAKVTERVVWPIGLWFWGKVWTLIGSWLVLALIMMAIIMALYLVFAVTAMLALMPVFQSGSDDPAVVLAAFASPAFIIPVFIFGIVYMAIVGGMMHVFGGPAALAAKTDPNWADPYAMDDTFA